MKNDKFNKSLHACIGTVVKKIDVYEVLGKLPEKEFKIDLEFENDIKVQISYWRIFANGHSYSSFQDDQSLSYIEKIFADNILNRKIESFVLDSHFRDLVVTVSNTIILQVLSLTRFEDWMITFPDGSEDYSNFI